jgi:YidC/Oxa1 family membrane protein insertase
MNIFTTLFYQPLYNGLVALLDIAPWMDAGIAVIVFTSLVKLVLFPLSKQSVRTQLKIKEIEPELQKIKENHKDKTEQALKTMELYKKNSIRPFAGILLIFIQLPIVFSLYRIFIASGLPVINVEMLYSFVPTPESVNVMFLGLFDITAKSMVLAGAAALAQYFQVHYSMPVPKKVEKPTFKDDLARSMSLQMKYMFPVIIFFIAYTTTSAIALYFTTSSIFMIAQELYLRKTLKKNKEVIVPVE